MRCAYRRAGSEYVNKEHRDGCLVGYWAFGLGIIEIAGDRFLAETHTYSKKSWPTLLAVAGHHGPDKVQLRVQPLSWANYRQSWDVTKAIFAAVGADSDLFF